LISIPTLGNTRDVLSLTHVGLCWAGAARGGGASTPTRRCRPRGEPRVQV